MCDVRSELRRAKRLGCIKGGAVSVKNHKWFNKIDWGAASLLLTPFLVTSLIAGSRTVPSYSSSP